MEDYLKKSLNNSRNDDLYRCKRYMNLVAYFWAIGGVIILLTLLFNEVIRNHEILYIYCVLVLIGKIVGVYISIKKPRWGWYWGVALNIYTLPIVPIGTAFGILGLIGYFGGKNQFGQKTSRPQTV